MFRLHNPVNRLNERSVEWEEEPLPPRLELREEHAVTLLRHNTSPDLGFSWSLNAYGGCTHACIYCYARKNHEYYDLSAGTDFERIVFVKRNAPALLDAEFRKASWKGEAVAMSGVTDCYQPIERKLQITRKIVETFAAFRNPLSVITRSPLIVRDLDVFQSLAAVDAVRVQLSIPVGDPALCRALEPGTASPAGRLRAVKALADAGIPVGVSVAPLIPGLTDTLMASTLAAAADAGARWAWMGLLRLPGSVETVFVERLREALPGRAEAVLNRIRATRGGSLSSSQFGERMRGSDPTWEITEASFRVHTTRLGLATHSPPFPQPSPFRVPGKAVQLGLFG